MQNKKPTQKERLIFYEDMEERFILFLDDATGSRMSKSNYELHAMLTELHDYQEELHYSIVKDDINDIINKGKDNEEILKNIKKYIDKL